MAQCGYETGTAFPEVTTGEVHEYFEITPCNPRTSQLRTLLQKFPYKGQDEEPTDQSQLVRIG